jgi:hypothetical protein
MPIGARIRVELRVEMPAEDVRDSEKLDKMVVEAGRRIRESLLRGVNGSVCADWEMKDKSAMQILNRAIDDYYKQTGLNPLVALLNPILFDKYAREKKILESVMPEGAKVSEDEVRSGEFAHLRLIADEEVETVEVF